MIGGQIAAQLHCVLMMMLSEEIELPREPVAIGGVTMGGEFVYNPQYSAGEIDEMSGEYRGVIEEQKLTKLHEMNRLIGSNGLVSRQLLKGHNVILVSDGIKNSMKLDLAAELLKPIRIENLIVATPLASVQAVDRMHILADDIYCLSVLEDYSMETAHYYDLQDVPDRDTAIKTIRQIILNWK